MSRGRVLLDANVLIAATMDGHQHHESVAQWLAKRPERLATCPITEGALIRAVLRSGDGIGAALALLHEIKRERRHEFWEDDISYADVQLTAVVGHKQVTDAYLAQLARARGGRLATLDRPLAALHSDVAELVPTS